jgi:hypothetical protein
VFTVGWVVTLDIMKDILCLKKLSSLSVIRDSLDGVVSRLMAGRPKNRTLFLGRRRAFFSPKTSKTDPNTNHAFVKCVPGPIILRLRRLEHEVTQSTQSSKM